MYIKIKGGYQLSYSNIEKSTDSGQPYILVSFTGLVNEAFTNAQENIIINGLTYYAGYIEHEEIKQTDNIEQQDLTILIKSTSKVGQIFIQSVPQKPLFVNIFRNHVGSTGTPPLKIWSGFVASSSCTSANNKVTLTCKNAYSQLERIGLRRRFSPICTLCLYDLKCNVSEFPFTQKVVVSKISGSTITIDSIDANTYFIGGFVKFGEYNRAVYDQIGKKIILYSNIPTLKVSNEIFLSAGCDKTMKTCREKFNNLRNFYGFPWVPEKNIFSGDSLAS